LRNPAGDPRAVCAALAVKGAPQELDTVIHNVHTHARIPARDVFPPGAVIGDFEFEPALVPREANPEVPRSAVFDGVIGSFLGDPIEVRGGGHITVQTLRVHVAAADDSVSRADARSELFEGRGQTLGGQADGIKSLANPTGLGDGLVEEPGDLFRRLGVRMRSFDERLLERIGANGQANQLLAQPIVNILTDARLLAVADFEDLTLKPHPFSHVDRQGY
jgi:hypothetical protein